MALQFIRQNQPLPQTRILPLPTPVGRDPQNVVREPVTFNVSPRGRNPALITDTYGREIVTWTGKSFSLSKRHALRTAEGKALGTLRIPSHPVVLFLRSTFLPRWILESPDEEGAIFAKFQPVGTRWDRKYMIQFRNHAADGQPIVLHLRESLAHKPTAIMWEHTPVALIERPNPDSSDYQVLIAPGADLLWIATLMSILEYVYHYIPGIFEQ